MLTKTWAFGDKVIHADRAEWGVGVITATAPDHHEGKPCQRLTVRFDRAGVKNLSSALANLVYADQAPALTAREVQFDDPFSKSSASATREVMLAIPDTATDPFVTPRSRLQNTLKLYRFTDQPGMIIEWAAAQSGLKDPLSKFSRHEIEDYFKRWCQLRDDQLRRVLFELKKLDHTLVTTEMKTAPRQAQNVYKKLDSYPPTNTHYRR